MQYELFLKSNFSHKCINISTVICMFFYTYQRFLVIFLDCAVLALHSACKNSLSSYQTMGSRNSRLFKFGHSVVKTQSPLTASRWEAKTSPGMAKASLTAQMSAQPPLSPQGKKGRNHLPRWHLCSHGAHPSSLPPPLTITWSETGIVKVVNVSV